MTIRVLIREKPDRANLLLYYCDPLTGLEKSKSARTSDRKQAERAAAVWEQEVRSGFLPSSIDWEGFRQRFEDEHLPSLSKKARMSYATALNHFEKLVGKPRELAAVSASTVSKFQGALRREEKAESSIATYLVHLRSALRWAASLGMIPQAPTIKVPRTGKRKLMRGRPLTDGEFQQLIDATPEVVTEEFAPEWQRLLRGLWLCGLRIDEALRLSWSDPPAQVDLTARFPRIIWHSEGHKSRRDEVVPTTPDFADFLRETLAARRHGRVFTPLLPTRRVTGNVASRTISAIGEASGVVVNDKGKHASAHDLRRSFGSRWAMKVRPVTLQALMRHSSIETTLRFYIDLNCDDVGAELWGQPVIETVPTNVPNEPVGSANSNGKHPEKQGKQTRRDIAATCKP